ncbi:hypothetical protein BON30_46290 [Cystobacter ferrugineus]|uniref:Protein kinase domain-containing protein n=2 Tax=Cystobacter ferrugineus TaxID=83449 RepID=A0A1L9AVA5_9BACT|nr:hypothetical protein BON30_46290 [Cystobacter ferrugineus]
MAASPDYRTPLLASCSLASPRGGVFPRWVELLPFRLEELDSQIAERCVFELLRAGKAAHSNLARMGGVVFDERTAYLRMQHLPGAYLHHVLEAAHAVGRGVSSAFAAYVVTELADALLPLPWRKHGTRRPLSLVHRAVGPMRIRVGASGRVQLTHLGLVYWELKESPPLVGSWLRGDAAYLAPEALHRFFQATMHSDHLLSLEDLDARADVFSLGLVLLEMLLPRAPLAERESLWMESGALVPPRGPDGETSWVEWDVLARRVLPFGPMQVRRAADFVPVPLQRIIARALRREPEERYATVSDMHSALYCYLHGLKPLYGQKELAREAAGILAEAASLGWVVSPEAHGAGFPLAAVDTFRSSPRSVVLLSSSSPS